jgi:hypothetical protein
MSSSSSSEFELESDCRRLVHFVVEHADGTEEPIPAGGVAFIGGANLGFTIPEDDDTVSLALDPAAGSEDPYFRAKYNALAGMAPGETSSGEGIDTERPAWVFTDDTLYVTAINNVLAEPLSGALFLTGDACHNIGQFESGLNPGYPEDPVAWEGSSSSVEGGQLSIFNMCIPCVDCLTFYELAAYLDRITIFYDYIFDLTYTDDTVNPPEHPDGGVRETFVGTMQQTMASLRYWDNLLNRSTVKLSAQSFGQSVVGAAYYRNISDRYIGNLPNGVTLTLTFTFQKVDSGGNVTDWNGISASITDVQIMDREGRCSAALGPTGITFIGSNEVQVQTVSGALLGPGQEIFSDVALVLLGTIDTNDANYSYQVAVHLEVSHTHLGDSGNDNPVEKDTLVYFRPPDPEPSS